MVREEEDINRNRVVDFGGDWSNNNNSFIYGVVIVCCVLYVFIDILE